MARGRQRQMSAHSPGVSQIAAAMRTHGFELAASRSVEDAHALADKLIPGPIAPLRVVETVNARTGASVYLMREQGAAAGFLAFFWLSPLGARAIMQGKFDARNVAPEWACPPGPDVENGYVWGFAGASRRACFSVVRAGRMMREAMFPHLRLFARAASPQGGKIMQALGFGAVVDADPSLCVSPPLAEAFRANA